MDAIMYGMSATIHNPISKSSLFLPGLIACSAEAARGLDRAIDGAVSLPISIAKGVGSYIRWSQPYQPYIAAIKIIGTAAWKKHTAKPIQKKIDRIGVTIQILKDKAEANPAARRQIDKKILSLRAQKRELKLSLRNCSISLMDLPCLLFEHPGSNAWKSCTSLAGRICSICHHASPMKKKPLCNAPLKAITQVGCGVISLLGTSVSLLKQVGAIEGTSGLSQGLVGAAFMIQGIETCIMVKKSVGNFVHKKMVQNGWIEPPPRTVI